MESAPRKSKRDQSWNPPVDALEQEDVNAKPKVEVFTIDSASSLLAPKKPIIVNFNKERHPRTQPTADHSQTNPRQPFNNNGYPPPFPPPAAYFPPAYPPAQFDPYGRPVFPPPAYSHPYFDPAQFGAKEPVEEKKKEPTIHRRPTRAAGGMEWDDPTLNEWANDDYRIFVGNLGNEVSDEGLKRAFNQYKSIHKAKVLRDKKTGKSRGYGFVSFMDPHDFIRALKEMQGKYICNRPCKLTKSRWKDRNIDKTK